MDSIQSPQQTSTEASPEQDPRRGLLAFFALLSVITLSLGGWLTSLGFGPWYDELLKPPFQPPGWVFSPAWTTLFTLLAIATWRVARQGEVARLALWVYSAQLVFNVLWSLFFFTLHQPAWALVDIAILNGLVVMTVGIIKPHPGEEAKRIIEVGLDGVTSEIVNNPAEEPFEKKFTGNP